MAVVLGAPGGGKSTLALEWVDSCGLPCLYISLDTPLVDQAVRYIARHTGVPTEQIEEWPVERQQAELQKIESRVRFFGLSIRAHSVQEVIRSETEYWGEPPAIVIVDNMKNLLEKEESAAEYERLLGELHTAARDTNSFVMVLHHVIRPKRDEKDKVLTRPLTLTDGMYAGERDVSWLLGLWRPQDDRLRVAVLKNRMGRADPVGGLNVTFDFQGALARVKESDSVTQWVGAQR